MLTPAELALFLTASASRTRHQLVEVTTHLMKEGETDAKAMIGREDNGWPLLAPPTIAQKERLGYVGRISATDPLFRTGDMRETIKGEAQATGAGAEGVIGSSSGIAAFHENGTSRMPPRPVFMPTMIKTAPKGEKEFGLMAVSQLLPPIR